MEELRKDFLIRGLKGRCPGCNDRNIFRTRYRLHERCPKCGLALEHEDGWALGAIPLNYTIACVFWVLPVACLFLFGLLPLDWAIGIAAAGAVILPFLTYRFSKALWTGIYYSVLPGEIPGRSGKEKGTP